MKKFCAISIENLEEFRETMQGNRDVYYKSPFAILAELEKEVESQEHPEPTILIPYKEVGNVIFELQNFHYEGGVKVATYSFNSTIS